MIAYVDASVILRIVLRQQEMLKAWKEVQHGIASTLVEVECLRTLDRARQRGEVSDAEVAAARSAVVDILGRVETIEVTRPVLRRAAQPMPTQIGTLDAIHLSTALLWSEATGDSPTMATHDAALATAARAHGLAVVGIQ